MSVSPAERIKSIALDEMLALVGRALPDRLRRLLRSLTKPVLGVAAGSIAQTLVAFDRDLARRSLRRAALDALTRYGVEGRVEGPGLRLSPLAWATAPLPARGPLLLVANHPGLFDALALFAAVGREDLRVIAARRPLLEALPALAKRLLFVDLEPDLSPQPSRQPPGWLALRRAVRHLREGHALLHFPAGRIEPDPRLLGAGVDPLLTWKPGLSTLVAASSRVRADLSIAAVAISGVVSRRARTLVEKVARGDLETDAIVPLIQLTFPGFGDVDVQVHVGPVRRAVDLGARVVDVLRADMRAAADGRAPPPDARGGSSGGRRAAALR